jgi:hypothetical protein
MYPDIHPWLATSRFFFLLQLLNQVLNLSAFSSSFSNDLPFPAPSRADIAFDVQQLTWNRESETWLWSASPLYLDGIEACG